MLAPTCVAELNMNGTTIYTGLRINVGGKMYPLNALQKAALCKRLSELRFLIIDEISMVSNVLLYQVRQRLNEII